VGRCKSASPTPWGIWITTQTPMPLQLQAHQAVGESSYTMEKSLTPILLH
jgi:hypothetical protein